MFYNFMITYYFIPPAFCFVQSTAGTVQEEIGCYLVFQTFNLSSKYYFNMLNIIKTELENSKKLAWETQRKNDF